MHAAPPQFKSQYIGGSHTTHSETLANAGDNHLQTVPEAFVNVKVVLNFDVQTVQNSFVTPETAIVYWLGYDEHSQHGPPTLLQQHVPIGFTISPPPP